MSTYFSALIHNYNLSIPEEISRGQYHLSLCTESDKHRVDGHGRSGILRLLFLRSDLNLIGGNTFSGGNNGRFLHRNLVSKSAYFTFHTFTALQKVPIDRKGPYLFEFSYFLRILIFSLL